MARWRAADFRGRSSWNALRAALGLAVLLPASLAAVPGPPEKAGFPLSLTGGGAVRAGHPLIADLGLTPGHKSIVFGTENKLLYVILYNGTVATGFPQSLPAETSGSPAVGVTTISGQSKTVIVVPYGSTFSPSDPGGVRAYLTNGTLLWDRPSGEFGGATVADPVIGAPVIGNVSPDGVMEVAWGSVDDHVYLVRLDTGQDRSDLGWPVAVRDSIRSSPALYDIDGDGHPDIIIGVDAHQEQAPYNTPNGGCLHVFRYDTREVFGFPRCVDQTIVSSAAVGDIDGDGAPEIVVGTGDYWPNGTHAVYAFKCDGTVVPGWPVSVQGQVFTSPALADLSGTGSLDVIVTDDNTAPSTTFHVYAFKGDGTLIFQAVPLSYFGTTPDAGDPVVADVLGDGGLEILVPVNSELAVFSPTGTQLTDNGSHPPGATSFFTEATIAAGDVDNFEAGGGTDPLEVVAISSVGTTTRVHVFNPKVSTNIPWGVFHHDAARTGVAPNAGSCPNAFAPTHFYTVTPCRAIDTRLAAGPYGGPAIQPQNIRTFTITGQCGVPQGAIAVSANLTVVTPADGGDIRAYPGAGPSPLISTINYAAGAVKANSLVLRLGAGECSIENDQVMGTVNVLLDINGYFK
jgi:hypothetical protein